MAQRLPDVKLIVLLRDPVTRALSHYNHECARGRETLSFEDALDAEADRLREAEARSREDPRYYSYELRNVSYLWRGMYASQLKRWFSYFPREQFLVLQSEALFEDPAEVYQRVIRFLGLPEHHLTAFPVLNSRAYGGMDTRTRSRVASIFAESNEELFDMIGERFDWSLRGASDASNITQDLDSGIPAHTNRRQREGQDD